MAHLAVKDGYHELVDRLNRFPQGAPATERLFQILALLFSEREAQLVSQLPVKPFTAKTAAQIWKVSEVEARLTLEGLASRVILLDAEQHGEMVYVLPPPMAGFFEFSMMRVRDDIDQKLLGELFYEYITVEEDFMRALLLDGETPLGRVFVNEPAIEQSRHPPCAGRYPSVRSGVEGRAPLAISRATRGWPTWRRSGCIYGDLTASP